MGTMFYTLLFVSALSVSCTGQEVVDAETLGISSGNPLDRIEALLNSVLQDVESMLLSQELTKTEVQNLTKYVEKVQEDLIKHQKEVQESMAEKRKPSCDHCQVLYDAGYNTSGVYKIKLDGVHTEVYCEHELDVYGPGWTVFQRRFNGTVDFNRNWDNYTQGFGQAAGEYWLGLDRLHSLTSGRNAQLLVELGNGTAKAYAHYSAFSIGGPYDYYQLHLSGFSNGQSSAGNALHYNNGMYFSTHDNDNDAHFGGNCASHHHSAWWYRLCSYTDLNGPYGTAFYYWVQWSGHGAYLDASRMMIKTM